PYLHICHRCVTLSVAAAHRFEVLRLPFFFYSPVDHRDLHSFPTRRSSDLLKTRRYRCVPGPAVCSTDASGWSRWSRRWPAHAARSEEHTSELQSRENLVCRLLLEKKKQNRRDTSDTQSVQVRERRSGAGRY